MSGFNLKMLKCRYIQVWSSYVFKMFNISKIQKKKELVIMNMRNDIKQLFFL